ncbi:MAG: rhomboid family intramembrane serine protease [Spirosomataceae bacterium]
MMNNLTPVVRTLLLINVLVFVLQSLFNNDLITYWFGLHYIKGPSFMPHQLLTHMFLHGGFGHLLSNMFGLFMFGPLLEYLWKPKRFLFFYLFTGIGAGILYSAVNYYEVSKLQAATEVYLQNPGYDGFVSFVNKYVKWFFTENYDFLESFRKNPTNQSYISESTSFVKQYFSQQENLPMVGASGAIFGILMAFGLLFPNTELMLLFFPFPIKAKYFVILYGGYELYAGIQRSAGDNVAHFAHIGGMLFAVILVRYWSSQRNNFY